MRIAGESPSYEPIAVPTAAAGAQRREPARGPAFSSVLRSLGKAVDSGESLITRAASGGLSGLGSADLIALQARIYHYSEAVDLTAKMVDRATSAVRSIVSGH